MKLTILFKKIIFLSTLTIIIFLSIINQRQSTKLKILIWTTPSLSLGSYLAISTGTGFFVSYFVTASLYGLSNSKQTNKIKYKFENQSIKNNLSNESIKNNEYDKTLIERDINDPSPTINASFRVIGRTERSSFNYKTSNNNDNDNDEQYEGSSVFVPDLDEQTLKNSTINQSNSITSDWDDETYSAW